MSVEIFLIILITGLAAVYFVVNRKRFMWIPGFVIALCSVEAFAQPIDYDLTKGL
jgi:hypothetical protein